MDVEMAKLFDKMDFNNASDVAIQRFLGRFSARIQAIETQQLAAINSEIQTLEKQLETAKSNLYKNESEIVLCV